MRYIPSHDGNFKVLVGNRILGVSGDRGHQMDREAIRKMTTATELGRDYLNNFQPFDFRPETLFALIRQARAEMREEILREVQSSAESSVVPYLIDLVAAIRAIPNE